MTERDGYLRDILDSATEQVLRERFGAGLILS
jgi:hypothetical protein